MTAAQIKAAQDHLKENHQPQHVQPLAKTVESFSRDASDEEKNRVYLIDLRGSASKRFVFQMDSLSLEIRTAYDPTHIHPYAVRKEHVRIPLQTGNPELDF